MSKQVLSIEQMRYLSNLIPLGLETDFIWWGKGEGINPEQYKWELHCRDTAEANPQCDWIYPAYTLQDILDTIPEEIMHKRKDYYIEMWIRDGEWNVGYLHFDPEDTIYANFSQDKNLLNASYEMLLWCINEGHVKTRKEANL